jgi:predicted nuclease of predicted toxin-antitoxin system
MTRSASTSTNTWSPVIAAALRQHAIDVTTTHDVHLRTRADPDHLRFCIEHRRVLVSRDADFLRLAPSTTHPGIVSCRRRNLSPKRLIEGLILIHALLTPEEMCDHIEYL